MVVWVKPSGQEDDQEALGGVLRVEEPNQVCGSVSFLLSARHAWDSSSKGVSLGRSVSVTAAADDAAGRVLQHTTCKRVQTIFYKHHSLAVKPTESWMGLLWKHALHSKAPHIRACVCLCAADRQLCGSWKVRNSFHILSPSHCCCCNTLTDHAAVNKPWTQPSRAAAAGACLRGRRSLLALLSLSSSSRKSCHRTAAAAAAEALQGGGVWAGGQPVCGSQLSAARMR